MKIRKVRNPAHSFGESASYWQGQAVIRTADVESGRVRNKTITVLFTDSQLKSAVNRAEKMPEVTQQRRLLSRLFGWIA